ncbi:MAG: DEAD/DEAH box helicase, partial [Atopostipes suicloacalis]|nr:DEAD/DEAH box helicase [Atopostipes suicloacalis]
LNMYEVSGVFEYEFYLKVGVDHLYVVNDIIEVTDHLLKGINYSFGKQLIYKPEDFLILQEDRNLLTYINEVAKTQEETFSKVHGGRSPEKDGMLSIPAQHVPEIIELLTEVEGGFVRIAPPPRLLSSINQIESPELMPRGKKIPLTFILEEKDEVYLLDLKEEDKKRNVRLHSKANILSIDAHFYMLSPEDFRTVKLIIETFKNMKKEALELSKEDLTSLYSLIIPKLKDLFNYEVEAEIEDELKKAELETQLYVDYEEEELTVEPRFKYGEYVVNPLLSSTDDIKERLTDSDDSTIIVRDVYEESDVKNVLTHFFKRADVKDGKYSIKYFNEISLFLYDSLSELTNLMEVYLSTSAQELIYDVEDEAELSIEMNRTTNLLDIRFDIQEIPDNELPQLVQQLQKSDERFYKLDSGKIIDLEEEKFEKIVDQVNKLELDSEEIEEETSVSLLRGLSLAEDESIKMGEEFVDFIKELKEPDHLKFDLPNSLDAVLRPYQESGFKWLSLLDYYGLGGVLADDMGLGKTIQTIAFLLRKIEQEPGKYLVISPSSVVYNWQKEFSQFAPSIKTAIISGSIEEREEQFEEAMQDKEVSVLITSYPLIQRDINFYEKVTFNTIILDESQTVKNDAAKTTKAVRELKAKNIFALSGTPIENNLNELWSLFSIILPGLFRSKKIFNNMSQEEIAQRIEIFVLRRMKEDVLEDLPPKTETVEYIELYEEQKRLYQAQLSMIQTDVKDLLEKDTFEQNRMRVLAGMTRLRQISLDPRLVDEDYTGGAAKLDRLMEYLGEALANKKRVVLFSQFTSMLSIIREILDEKEVDYHYLDGNTPKMDRLELTTRFNEGEKDLFLISLRAGGTGLNLTGGDTVILFDSWWNPAIEDQAADRVHRYGQDKSVQVIRMIMRGTIEEGIHELQDQKRELIDTVIRTDDEKKVSSLTKDDIIDLLIN